MKMVKIEVKLDFWANQPLLHTVLQLVAFALLLVSLVFCLAAIGVFAKEFNQVKDDADKIGIDGDVCFLDSRVSTALGIKYIEAGKNSYCDFVIFGHSFVAISLGALFLLLAIIMFLRFSIGLDAVVFLVVAVVSFLLSFITSIVLSNGFAKTCQAVKDISDGNMKCSNNDLPQSSQPIYNAVLRSTIFSWIETISVGAVVIIACVYVVLRMSRRGYRNLATQ